MSPTRSAAELDAADPLGAFPARFVPADGVVAYLDGNSLGRPVAATGSRMASFLAHDWGTRLIRSWDEEWMDAPYVLGDRLAALTLGGAAGQTIVADSTTVLLYKLARAAVAFQDGRDGRGGRDEVVVDSDNFPTDRFVLEGIAAECGLTLRWITPDPALGVTPSQVAEVVGERTALVVLSHVAYRSGYVASVPSITSLVHDAGGLVLWDLCHSVGVLPVSLDEWGIDLAVGCTYKYLNGGPGAPAFAYVRSSLQESLTQPIQGWMGAADVFAMGPGYEAGPGMRRFVSGTPPVLGMLPLRDMLDLIEEAGVSAIRAKSLLLTQFVIDWAETHLGPLGVRVVGPREDAHRGGHVTLAHPAMREVTAALWSRGVIPDFRFPDGLRVGLSPLSTTFTEVEHGLQAVREELRTRG